MNIYLDIDGVLLANEENLAIGADEFIKYVAENFEVYWLTTHCMNGDPTHAIEYVQRATDEDLRPYLEKFKPTTWSLAKTEAIDFTQPFLWFDDDCYSGEQRVLKERNVFDSWIEIDLAKYPDQLTREMRLLQSVKFDTAWNQMTREWFKVEVLQDYSGEDDGPSLAEWKKGNKPKSLELMLAHGSGWASLVKNKAEAGVLMRRVRIIERPASDYTEWEIEHYKRVNIPNGERVYLIDKDEVKDLDLPTGDFMIFDNRRVFANQYDSNGRMIAQTFYDENDDIARFMSLKDKLLAIAKPVDSEPPQK